MTINDFSLFSKKRKGVSPDETQTAFLLTQKTWEKACFSTSGALAPHFFFLFINVFFLFRKKKEKVSPEEIRTPVNGFKARHTWPLYDGAILEKSV